MWESSLSGDRARLGRRETHSVATIVVSIGSNVEPEQNLRSAVRSLRRVFDQIVLSRVYRSKAVGFEGADFLNLVVSAHTNEGSRNVVDRLRDIEAAHRRDRSGPRFGPRTLDLDLLLYDDQVLAESNFRLPREEITEQAFVLRPLAELLPNARHPVLGRTYAELWASFDQVSQPLWPIPFAWDEQAQEDAG